MNRTGVRRTPLGDLDLDLLERMRDEYGPAFARPRDLGAYDASKGSLHAQRLARLTQLRLAARERVNAPEQRRARYAYAITFAGLLALVEHGRPPRRTTA